WCVEAAGSYGPSQFGPCAACIGVSEYHVCGSRECTTTSQSDIPASDSGDDGEPWNVYNAGAPAPATMPVTVRARANAPSTAPAQRRKPLGEKGTVVLPEMQVGTAH